MRLLRTGTASIGGLEIKEFNGQDRPPYAILSHTWGEDEVLYADLKSADVMMRAGFKKIEFTLDTARRQGLEWAWIDTACINKDSSAELSEAINAMFAWYQQADICYVYLSDVYADLTNENAWQSGFHHARWFSRGWTLQELLAPNSVTFFASDGQRLGTKSELLYDLQAATGIGAEYLSGHKTIYAASIARRMSWAATRSTTRVEDLAYCLMGLFDVNMPMLYGEGPRAFIRLQEEIMKGTDDQTLFAWRAPCDGDRHGLLADSPAAFQASGDVTSLSGLSSEREGHSPHAMTNRGLHMELPSRRHNGAVHIQLECWMQSMPSYIGIILQPAEESTRHYLRSDCEHFIYLEDPLQQWSSIFVRQNVSGFSSATTALHRIHVLSFPITANNTSSNHQYRFLQGVYVDVLGKSQNWNVDDHRNQRDTVKIARQPGLPSAYLVLPPTDGHQSALLIGSDSLSQLAFDVWEPGTKEEGVAFVRDLDKPSARSSIPPWLRTSFQPQIPGSRMTKLQHYDVEVTVDRLTSGVHPVQGLTIRCHVKADRKRDQGGKSKVATRRNFFRRSKREQRA